LKFSHEKTVIYKQKDNHHLIERQEIQVQVLPSLKFGLKLLVCIKKPYEKKCNVTDERMLLIVDERLEKFYLSESLIDEWSLVDKN